jgi:hypothetical protein
VTLAPGTEGPLAGPFRDQDGHDVTVVVKVGGCSDQIERTGARVDRATDRWTVELPPDTSYELEGLVDGDVALRLTIVTDACPGTDAPAADDLSNLQPAKGPDVVADIAPDVPWDLSLADVAALRPDDDDATGPRRGSEG